MQAILKYMSAATAIAGRAGPGTPVAFSRTMTSRQMAVAEAPVAAPTEEIIEITDDMILELTGLASVVAIQEMPMHWREGSFASGTGAPPMGRLGRLTIGVVLFEPVFPIVGPTSSVVGGE